MEILTLALGSERGVGVGGRTLLVKSFWGCKGWPLPPPSDENECVLMPMACGNASCHNTLSGFHCVCHSGFVFDQTLGSCQDVDEYVTRGTL